MQQNNVDLHRISSKLSRKKQFLSSRWLHSDFWRSITSPFYYGDIGAYFFYWITFERGIEVEPSWNRDRLDWLQTRGSRWIYKNDECIYDPPLFRGRKKSVRTSSTDRGMIEVATSRTTTNMNIHHMISLR